MDHYFTEKRFDGYVTRTRYKKAPKDKFIQMNLINAAAPWYKDKRLQSCVSTKIDRTRFSLLPFKIPRDICFMALDCDSDEDKLAAIICLKRYGINWGIIESSPGKFWLITDFIGTSNEVVNYMRKIVGVDERYVDMCNAQRTCFIRATPDVNRVPKIIDVSDIKDTRILAWAEEYRELIAAQKDVTFCSTLSKALHDKTLYSLVSDPDCGLL